jgi:hypothetical protein
LIIKNPEKLLVKERHLIPGVNHGWKEFQVKESKRKRQNSECNA